MKTVSGNSNPAFKKETPKKENPSFGFGGGHHGGGGHRGGGFRGWGGWGYPFYPYPYPYYDSSLYVETPLADENFVVENGLIKKKKKKVVEDKKMSAAGDPPPRPINPQGSNSSIKTGKIGTPNYVSFGLIGLLVGGVVAISVGKSPVLGAVIGATALGGAAYGYGKYKK